MAGFGEGDWIYSLRVKSRGKIIERIELWGHRQYRVWFPKDDRVLLHAAEDLSLEPKQPDASGCTHHRIRWVLHAAKLIELVGQEEKLLAPVDSSVIALPHQIEALSRIVNAPRARLMLADEVGLGKTIEAGLAIKELKLRGLAQRILIVAPSGLIPQWIVEMREKFGEEFRYFAPANFDAYRAISGADNVWKSFDQVICSMDAVKPLDKRKGWNVDKVQAYNEERILGVASAGWDLVVIDEAHRVAGSSNTVSRHMLAKVLAESSPNLLLLSATPHQGKTESFHRLMSLIDPDAFADESDVTKEKVQPYIVRSEKRSTVDHRGQPLFKPRLTRLIPIPWDADHAMQQELYDGVTEYVRNGYNQAKQDKNSSLGFLMILMQRLVTSSTQSILKTLERRLEQLRSPAEQTELFSAAELFEIENSSGEQQMDAALNRRIAALKNERSEVELLIHSARKVISSGPDVKARALLDLIYKLRQDEGDPALKVLIFTEFVPTQMMLSEYLGQSGFEVVSLNGSLNMEERKDVQRQFAEKAQILISTDAGGEGLNLQFCHVIINYDLGWRPMALEQRIGRVDRIGQKHVVKALNLVLEDSVEFRVREVLESKLKLIYEEFGIDKTSDVLDSEEGAHIFDKLFIEALLNPESVESEVNELAEKLKAEARWNKDQLQSTAVSLTDAKEAICSEPIRNYLESLTENFAISEGGSFLRQGDKLEVSWGPDEAATRYVSAGKELDAGEALLTLDHPKIRSILGGVTKVLAGDPMPIVALGSMPGGIGGSWSLWKLSLEGIHTGHVNTVFPVFIQAGGKVFDRTALVLWQKLMSVTAVSGFLSQENSVALYREHYQKAEKVGLEAFDRMRMKYAHALEVQEKNKINYFRSRRAHANRIGLAEVRDYEFRKIDMEQSHWQEDLKLRKRIQPKLEALMVMEVKAV